MMRKKMAFLLCMISCLLLFGCGKNQEDNGYTKDDFIKICSGYGFEIIDMTSQIKDRYPGITNVTYAISPEFLTDGEGYEIHFYTFERKSDAEESFQKIKTYFRKTDQVQDKENSAQIFKAPDDEKYTLIKQEGNTILYSSCYLKYKESLEKMIKDLG